MDWLIFLLTQVAYCTTKTEGGNVHDNSREEKDGLVNLPLA